MQRNGWDFWLKPTQALSSACLKAQRLYGLSVNGRSATWFRGAEERHEGHISAGGVEKDVAFVDTDDLSSEIDAAFTTKYHRYAASIVNSELTPQARGATLRLTPRA